MEHLEPDLDNESIEALLPEQDQNDSSLPGAPPPQKEVQFCSVLDQVR